MADFNPPDSHWAADFDARLIGTFYHLKDRLEAALDRISVLEKERDALREEMRQGILDAKHYARGSQ